MKKRIFKFRAWDVNEREMVHFDKPQPGEGLLSTMAFLNNSTDEVVLMQWTGFVDSEGEDIYEGDVMIQHGEEGLLEVYWKEVWGCWMGYDNKEHGGGIEENLSDLLPVEVIGNIYENPELIKGEE